MISINNKYEVGQQVFIFKNGYIYHCHITNIIVNIHTNEIMYSYTLAPYSAPVGGSFYNVDENEICSSLEDMIHIIPIK